MTLDDELFEYTILIFVDLLVVVFDLQEHKFYALVSEKPYLIKMMRYIHTHAHTCTEICYNAFIHLLPTHEHYKDGEQSAFFLALAL